MSRSQWPPSAANALPIWAGSTPVSAAKADKQALIAGQMVQDADQEARLLRGGANLGRADAGDGEEAAEPLAVPGNEGKRLNCKLFCRFLG